MAFCSNCGKEIPSGSNFCTACGIPAPQQDAIQTDNAMDANAAPVPAYNAQTVSTDVTPEKRMHLIWGIIAMVLGIACIVLHVTWPSVALGIAALVLGIICLSKHSKLYGFAIVAIVLSVVNFLTYVIAYDALEKEMDAAKSVYSENETNVSQSDFDRKEVPAGVNPDLVAFLDEYEDFVDKYCEFMQKYSENPTDLSLLADYASIMQEYSDFAEKVNSYDSKSMSTADANYYIEVTTRCTQKMLTVVGNMGDSGTN
ncbi:DUF6591 domain-containing protein [Butyrivibrio sp. AE3004]|uniref:DUF6591 domain-containing protein n=1 Tax=Butyrivibrio sp. AE3004 TaxID=1506994 RepID=UPI0004943050|nr:DUF6591 domain-containing protein [Butyrivibrio sp. AE3004]